MQVRIFMCAVFQESTQIELILNMLLNMLNTAIIYKLHSGHVTEHTEHGDNANTCALHKYLCFEPRLLKRLEHRAARCWAVPGALCGMQC